MRLIASDIDGTILDHEGRISARVVAAFAAAASAGVHLVFVTGRPSRWLDPIRDQVGHRGTVICSNGANVFDLATGRSVLSKPIALQSALAARAAILERVPDAVFAAEALDGIHLEVGFGLSDTRNTAHVIPAPLVETMREDSGILKLLARAPQGSADEFLATVKEAVAPWVKATHSAQGVALLEMSACGVNKADTLAAYASQLGLSSRDVVAFGDMPNDVEMLAWAGEGYAMASGHPLAIAAAKYVAPSIAEDGVAQVIERLLTDD